MPRLILKNPALPENFFNTSCTRNLLSMNIISYFLSRLFPTHRISLRSKIRNILYKIVLLKLKWQLPQRVECELLLKRDFKRIHKRNLNTNNPSTFSEKLFTRMIIVNRNGNSLFTRLSDKFLVRDYVSEKIGEQHLVKLLWSGTNPEDIPYDTLPLKCAIKTNHGSGRNILFEKISRKSEVIEKLKKFLNEDFYWVLCEQQYYGISKRIIIEEFLDDGFLDGPLDYRFWCFDGKPEVIQVDNHSHDINPFYDMHWNKINLSYRNSFRDINIPEPDNFQEMLKIASVLSSGIDFVRVDLYNVKGKILFGEMTFTPVAGRFLFNTELWDKALGEKWNLVCK